VNLEDILELCESVIELTEEYPRPSDDTGYKLSNRCTRLAKDLKLVMGGVQVDPIHAEARRDMADDKESFENGGVP